MDYIQRLVNITTDEKFYIRIRRERVLEDTLISINRTAFSPYKTLVVRMCAASFTMAYFYEMQIKFLGEIAVDEGGPKREFWRLLGLEIRSKLCVGSGDRLTFSHNVLDLQVSQVKNDLHTNKNHANILS